jgi:hypothetical protein
MSGAKRPNSPPRGAVDAKKWGCQTINKVDVAHKGNSIRDWQAEVWSNEVVKNETEGYSDNGVHHNTIQLLSG